MSINHVTQAWSAYASTYWSGSARTADIAAYGDQKSTDETSKGHDETAQTDGYINTNVLTGTTVSHLSAETIGYVMQATQSGEDANAQSPLPKGIQNHLNDIANDPAYATKQAWLLGTGSELLFVGKELPTVNNGYTKEERNNFLAKTDLQMAQIQQVQSERSAYYENLKEQGLSPAKIYAKLLEFNANLPESHDAVVGWSESGRTISYSEHHNAQLDYLQNLIDQNGDSTSSA